MWLEALIIPYMAATSGWSGGSLKYHDKFPYTWMPEVLFSLGFAYATFPVFGLWCVLAALWSYVWMQSGPGPALQWGTDPDGMGRPRTLSPVINWLSDRFGFKRGDVNYCRLWMAAKGFLIGLPVGGIPLMILWPLSYEIGNRVNKHVVSECLAGAGAGISILIFQYLVS